MRTNVCIFTVFVAAALRQPATCPGAIVATAERCAAAQVVSSNAPPGGGASFLDGVSTKGSIRAVRITGTVQRSGLWGIRFAWRGVRGPLGRRRELTAREGSEKQQHHRDVGCAVAWNRLRQSRTSQYVPVSAAVDAR